MISSSGVRRFWSVPLRGSLFHSQVTSTSRFTRHHLSVRNDVTFFASSSSFTFFHRLLPLAWWKRALNSVHAQFRWILSFRSSAIVPTDSNVQSSFLFRASCGSFRSTSDVMRRLTCGHVWNSDDPLCRRGCPSTRMDPIHTKGSLFSSPRGGGGREEGYKAQLPWMHAMQVREMHNAKGAAETLGMIEAVMGRSSRKQRKLSEIQHMASEASKGSQRRSYTTTDTR